MSNMSLHCICLVLPLTRTLELLHVRCMACMTSRVAKPMAGGQRKKESHICCCSRFFFSFLFLNNLCGFFCLARNQECRIALAPPDGRLYISVSEPHWCSCQSSVAARPCRITDRGQTEEDRLLGNLTDETVFFFKFKVFLN